MEKICVAVRVRPATVSEVSWWKVEDNTRISLLNLSFAFDHVFDDTCTNAHVYDLLTKDIILAAVDGFNGTAFAYGQTSSGKTFTMNGSLSDPGIIHRAVSDVFHKIESILDREFLIRVSYMEIYNEEINDLLAVENQKLQIHESLERGVFVAGIKEEIVTSAEQVLKLLESGEVNRHFGETNMNARSSRSHTIFRMVIESKGKDTNPSGDYSSTDSIRVSVLNLVDLAGSERVAKTGAGGVRLKEGKYINKSLMVLGNVINKLSDGPKQRAHIPYRDSKLTRILQPALGGNAKTSIICTVAPEEVHVEETKGTLQFASRAKRITNCAQVNEILTDAALLKRQKLEIEELRNKLQGSRAEVLEQEILKLRNKMLKYEQDREKLEMELEEERRSHKQRDEHILEQQMKIDNLSSLVSSSESRGGCSEKQSLKEEFDSSYSISKGDAFRTPCFSAAPNAFVARRSNYSRMHDYSPVLEDTFSNVADEDMWMKMNNGYVADLESFQMTPSTNVQSFPSSDATPMHSTDNHKEVILKMTRQLEVVTAEKKDLKEKHLEQLQLNDSLMEEISALKQQALLVKKIPQQLSESVASCKGIYKDALLTLQNFVPEEESLTAKLLSSMSEISLGVLSNLEAHFSREIGSDELFHMNDSPLQEQHNLLSNRLKDSITSLALIEKSNDQNVNVESPICDCNYKMEILNDELDKIKQKCQGLKKELDQKNQLLEVSREMFNHLEKEFLHLKEENSTLQEKFSESSRKLLLLTDEKENALKNFNDETQRYTNLKDDLKKISAAFASRQRSLIWFHSDLRSKVEELRTQNPVSVVK